jgi:hypothetical protein
MLFVAAGVEEESAGCEEGDSRTIFLAADPTAAFPLPADDDCCDAALASVTWTTPTSKRTGAAGSQNE